MDKDSMTNSLAFTEVHGDKDRTLVFLHGGGCAGWMWDAAIACLPGYHCLVPDLPEHGASALVKPFSMQLAAQKTLELIRSHAHGGRAVVVGLSEGAQVAVQMLADAPESISGALISSALLLPMPGGRLYSSPGLISALFKLSVPPFRNNDAWIRLNMKYAAGIPEAYFTQFKATFQATGESQFVNLMVANQTFRLPKNLQKADLPVLVTCGRHELKAMRESARLLSKELPQAQLRWIDLGKGSGLASEHNWALTAPQAFAESLQHWLEGKTLPKFLFET